MATIRSEAILSHMRACVTSVYIYIYGCNVDVSERVTE